MTPFWKATLTTLVLWPIGAVCSYWCSIISNQGLSVFVGIMAMMSMIGIISVWVAYATGELK
jgi:hypothetical protein